MSSQRLAYRPVNYDRMKQFMKVNTGWLNTMEWCKPEKYDRERECSCPACCEKYCDELVYENPRECSELSQELMDNVRAGNYR